MKNKIKRKGDKLCVKWNSQIIHLIVGMIKKILLYKNDLFSTLQSQKKQNNNKIYLKMQQVIDTQQFAKDLLIQLT